VLRDAAAEITLCYTRDLSDPRPLELVNKTNQFNLNGRRWTEVGWRALLDSPDVFQVVVSYKDKYSVLGKIAVLAGCHEGRGLRIEVWVMSCRAFSRHIEYACLAALLNHFGSDCVALDFATTERNGPMRDFIERLTGVIPAGSGRLTLPAMAFRAKCPVLYHQILEVGSGR
jgi:FkbH-like protein